MSFQGFGNVFFMMKRSELMHQIYTTFYRFANQVRFPKKMLESAGLPASYNRTFSIRTCVGSIQRSQARRCSNIPVAPLAASQFSVVPSLRLMRENTRNEVPNTPDENPTCEPYGEDGERAVCSLPSDARSVG